MLFAKQHTSKNHSQEIDFIRCCSLPRNLAIAKKQADPEHLDWPWMTNYAVIHGVAPIFRRGLGKLGNSADHDIRGGIYHESPTILRDSYLSTLKHNLRIHSALQELDDALTGSGIIGILWKGAAFIYDVYPGMGLRPMDDIDILIQQQHLEKFTNLIKSLGFVPRQAYPLTWHRREIVLDLHPDVVHGDRIASRLAALPITADTVAQEVRSLGDFRCLVTLSPRDTLITLAVHALKHGFSKDIWLMDALYLLNQYPETIIRPEKLVQRALDLSASYPLYILFSLLRMWPQNLDCKFLYHLHPPRFGFFFRHFVKSFAKAQPIPHAGELFYLFMMDSYRKKIAFILETMFPARHVMQQLFPKKQRMPYWFYYPLRIFRLLAMGMETLKALIRFS